RLIRDDEIVTDGNTIEAGARLRRQHALSLAGFALRQRLADAHDRLHAVRERRFHAKVHAFVGLAEVLAALAVPDDRVRGDLGDLRDADLAGERALFGRVEVLRADDDRRAAQLRGHVAQPDVRRADDLLDADRHIGLRA